MVHILHPNEIPPRLELDKELKLSISKQLKDSGWESSLFWIEVSDFTKDIFGSHEYPPTYKYNAKVFIRRSDGAFFYVNVMEHSEEIESTNVEALNAIVFEDFDNAVSTLNTFLTCSCGKDNEPCKYHKEWNS